MHSSKCREKQKIFFPWNISNYISERGKTRGILFKSYYKKISNSQSKETPFIDHPVFSYQLSVSFV